MAPLRDEREQLDFELWFLEGVVGRKADYVDALSLLANDYTARGLYQKGLEADRRLTELRPQDATVIYNLACSLSLTGQIDEAFSMLVRAIFLGYDDYRHIRRDPDLEAVRQDPRFRAFLEVTRREAAERKPKAP